MVAAEYIRRTFVVVMWQKQSLLKAAGSPGVFTVSLGNKSDL